MKEYALIHDWSLQGDMLRCIVEVKARSGPAARLRIDGKIIWSVRKEAVGHGFKKFMLPHLGDKFIDQNELKEYMAEHLEKFL